MGGGGGWGRGSGRDTGGGRETDREGVKEVEKMHVYFPSSSYHVLAGALSWYISQSSLVVVLNILITGMYLKYCRAIHQWTRFKNRVVIHSLAFFFLDVLLL